MNEYVEWTEVSVSWNVISDMVISFQETIGIYSECFDRLTKSCHKMENSCLGSRQVLFDESLLLFLLHKQN